MSDKIILKCECCGNKRLYDRDNDPNLPKEVETIVTTCCNECEYDEYCEERWLDKDGKEVPYREY